jgi:transposase
VAKEKPWTDKSYMYDRYKLKRWTIDQIAEECTTKFGVKVTPMTIYNHLKKFDLIVNSRNLGKRSYGNNSKKSKGYY